VGLISLVFSTPSVSPPISGESSFRTLARFETASGALLSVQTDMVIAVATDRVSANPGYAQAGDLSGDLPGCR
jgi:hypothetical protein